MNLSRLIKYNEAYFMVGSTFIKLWMTTMPIGVLWIIWRTLLLPGGGWIISLFAVAFCLGSFIANYITVRNYMNGDYPMEKQKKVDEFKAYLNKL